MSKDKGSSGLFALMFLCACALVWAPTSVARNEPLIPITFQLRWTHQFQFAGYYAALEQGYYREAGFDVTLREGQPGRTPVDEVLAGRAQYGEANSELLYWYLQGKPLVALAAIFQHSPSVLLARRDSSIRTPQDMIGKRVMLVSGHHDADFLAMFRNEGIGLQRLDIRPSSYNIQDLIDGKVDVFNAYLTNEPFFLRQLGIEPSIIYPSTYGIDFYSDILFTTRHEVEENPERVRAFRDATLRGWQYAMDHPHEIVNLLLTKYGTQKTRAHLEYEAAAMHSLILPDLVDIGHMNAGRWRHMAEVFAQQKMAPAGVSLDKFIYNPLNGEEPAWLKPLAITTAMLGVLASLWAWVQWRFSLRLRHEVAERREVEGRLRASERELRGILDNLQDAYYRGDKNGSLVMVTPSVTEILGYAPEELLGRHIGEFYVDPSKRPEFLEYMTRQGGKAHNYEILLQHKQGRHVWVSVNARFICDAKGEIDGVEGTIRDITDTMQTRAAIERQAYQDPLTELANRILLLERLQQEVLRSRRHHYYGAVLFIDLDNFKTINDTHGHNVGDELLQQVAKRLRVELRGEDLAARLGGDEFVLMLSELGRSYGAAANSARLVAEKIYAVLVEPYLIGELSLQTTPSIGVALFPGEGQEGAEDLLKQADIAMYQVKRQGRNGILLYQPDF